MADFWPWVICVLTTPGRGIYNKSTLMIEEYCSKFEADSYHSSVMHDQKKFFFFFLENAWSGPFSQIRSQN